MELLNLTGFTVDENGRVSFSGLSSGLDFRTIVGGIMTAKRIPVDILEARITENTDKIAALQDLRALLNSLTTSLGELRGAITFNNAGDTFAAKSVFATTSRTDGTAPSAAGNLMGVSVTNAAATGSHTLEVLRVAAQHKVASKSFTSETAARGLTGSFEITGSGGSATITVSSTDTLQDIRDRINNANTGSSATEVSASIVEISSTEFVLSITADETGKSMILNDSGTVLSGLGISSTNGAGGARNGLASSKIDATNDGFKHIVFDGAQADNSFLIGYSQSTKVLTLTRGDGTTDSATLSSTAIATGKTETATFSKFGVTIVLDDKFDKSTDILVEADAANITIGTATIAAGTIKITDSAGNISGIDSSTLTFGLADAANATLTITNSGNNFVSAAFDATTTGVKTITLIDAGNSANTITVTFDIQTAGFANGDAATITLNELKNAVGATGTQFDNELQAARTARFTADGLLDANRYESQFITSGTNLLSALAPKATAGDFKITVGANTVTVNYLLTDTLSGLVTKINAAITGSGGAVESAGTAASLMTDGDGVRLVITNTSGAEITLTDTNGVLAGLGVDNNQVIERTSNTISDLFTGITLTLFGAEEGTTVKLDIEQDLGASKAQILDVIDAYNALQIFINKNSLIDPTTGKTTEATGVLFGESILASIDQKLSTLLVQGVSGVSDAYSILGQIGIALIDRNQDDPLLENTLEVDETVLDAALLNNPDDVRRLFAFDFSVSDPRLALISFTGKTTYNAAGYKVNINFDDLFKSAAFTDSGSFTRVNAVTNGPASDGINPIGIADSVISGNAYRYSYDSATENLTLIDLTAGTSQTIDVTSLLDAAASAGAGQNLIVGESADVIFSTHNVTLSLSGTAGFDRTVDNITTGPLTVGTTGGITAATLTATNDQDGGITKTVFDALTGLAAYNAATGNLTFNTNSTTGTELKLTATTGLEFQIDGAGGFDATAGGADLNALVGDHYLDIRLSGSAEIIGRINFNTLAGDGVSAGTMSFNVGGGLFAETSDKVSASSPMQRYMTSPTLAAGTLEIRDSIGGLIGSAAFSTTDSLQDIAAAITASHADLTGSVVSSGGTFKLQIVHVTRDVLTFTESGGSNILAHLNLANVGDGVFSANINGAADGTDNGSVTISGRTITATGLTAAEGLSVFYTGTADLAAIQVDFTVGFAASMYFKLTDILDPTSGILETEIDALTDQNTVRQSRIDLTLARLELQREALLKRFFGLESALLAARNLRDSIAATFEALTNSQRNR